MEETHATLGRTLIVGLPVAVLLVFSIMRFSRVRNASAWLQLLGAGSFVLVVLAHVAEALHLFPAMRWGERHESRSTSKRWSVSHRE
jgi:hypothetical protein